MKNKIIFLMVFVAVLVSINNTAQTLTIDVSGVRSTTGQLQVAIFETSRQFDDEKPAKTLYIDKSGLSNGKKSIQVKLKPGTYAITVLDDEDKSKDMTYTWGIYPKEGVGFSNYKLQGLSKPDFSDFDFKITEDSRHIKVEIDYF